MLASAFLDPRYALVTLFAIGLAGIFLLPSDLDVMPGCGEHSIGLVLFDSKPDAAEYIRTLWQVEGAVLALSITVIVFAFQAIGSSRYGASIYEFAQDTRIYLVFYWGVVGLVVDGLVLLGLGEGAPNGGAGTWAVAVSLSSLPLVALVFSGTIRALDPDRIHDRRVRRLREEVGRTVEREIFERIALSLLEQRCGRAGVRLRLFSSDPVPEDGVVVQATRAGRVRNIDLSRLGSLQPTSGENAVSPSSPELRVRLGQEVALGQVVVVVPPSAVPEGSSASSAQKKIEKRARGVVKLERDQGPRPYGLARASERLHEEALAVIRSGSPSLYEDVLNAYEEALFAFPDAWRRYGQRFDSDIAGGLHPLGLGQTDAFLTNLAVELDEAARSSARDVAFKAAYTPARLARRAYPPDATALLEQALGLLDVVYRAAARPSPGNDDVARAVKEKVWMHLQEFADYPLAAAVESSETTPEDRRRAEAFLRQVFASYNALMKAMIEFGDLASLRATDLSWSGVFEHWTPEYERPFEGEADRLASEKGEDDTEVLELRRREELKRELVRAKEDFVDLRTTHRYGLCLWALRRVHYAGGGNPRAIPRDGRGSSSTFGPTFRGSRRSCEERI